MNNNDEHIKELKRDRAELKDLARFMSPNDKDEYLSLLKAGVGNSELELYANNAITSFQVNQSGMTYLQRESMADLDEYVGLNEDEKVYIKKFYSEYYANRLKPPEDFRLLKTEEIIKESNRIHNSRKTDAMDVAKNQGVLCYVSEDEWLERKVDHNQDEFLTWERVYSFLGRDEAMNFIISNMLDELSNGVLNPRLTAIRFYIKMERLRKLKARDDRNDKELEIEKK